MNRSSGRSVSNRPGWLSRRSGLPAGFMSLLSGMTARSLMDNPGIRPCCAPNATR